MSIRLQPPRMAVLIVVTVLTIVAAGVAGVLIVLEAHRTPDWQVALQDYAEADGLVVLQTSPATAPTLFDPALSRPLRVERSWQADELPQPPDEVWCALVERGHWPDGAACQVLLVAYHSDRLHHMGWVVHAAAQEPFGPALAAYVDRLGCDLGLDAGER